MLALRGGTVHRSAREEPLRGATVLLADGEIVDIFRTSNDALPARAQVVDCTGLHVAPAFWNSHVHVTERKFSGAASIPAGELAAQLSSMFLQYGFTNVFDLASEWDNTRRIRARIDGGEIAGPHIRTTGPGVLAPGALPSDDVHRMMGVVRVEAPEVRNAGEARDAAQTLLALGVDGIKVFASSPRTGAIDGGALRAAIEAAAAAGKPSFVHPNDASDVAAAISAGATVIAHTTPMSGAWESDLISAMRAAQAALTPTLALWRQFFKHDRLSAATRVCETAVDQLRMWHESGGEVLFGTDAGAVDYDPAPEYDLMHAAGMSDADILASLTELPARRFAGSAGVVRVAAGYPADIVVYGPSFADVRVTIRGGKPIFQR